MALDQITYSVQQQFDVFDALRMYGHHKSAEKHTHQLKCPFHQDLHKSARAYSNEGTDQASKLWCYACNKNWDGVAFVAQKEDLGYRAAAHWIWRQFEFDLLKVPVELEQFSVEADEEEKPPEKKTQAKTEPPYATSWVEAKQRLEKQIRQSGLSLERRIALYTVVDSLQAQQMLEAPPAWEEAVRNLVGKLKQLRTL
jgi:hypothetical protein